MQAKKEEKMKKLRHVIITIAVGATLLSGIALQGMGAASVASAASSQHVSHVSTLSSAAIPDWPCGSESDC